MQIRKRRRSDEMKDVRVACSSGLSREDLFLEQKIQTLNTPGGMTENLSAKQ